VFPDDEVAVTFAGVSPQVIAVGIELKVTVWFLLLNVNRADTEILL
jgi:hypothetical protein